MAGGGELVVLHLLVVALRADDAGQQSRVTSKLSPIECPLHDAFGETEHRDRQLHRCRILEINGEDRLVGVAAGEARQQRLELVRPDSDDHVAEVLRERVEITHCRAVPNFSAMCCKPGGSRFRKQSCEVHARNQQLAGRTRPGQAVAQNCEEGIRRSLRRQRIQRRDAQRKPKVTADRARLSVRLEQGRDADMGFHPEALALHGLHERDRPEPFAPGNSLGSGERSREVKRRRKRGRAKVEPLRVAQFERQAQQERVRIGTHFPHQPEQCRVGANEDVLAVVERAACGGHAPRAAARHRTALEHRDANPALRKRHRRGKARISASYDCYVRSQVEIAIQSLRMGVREVRWVSTLKPSASTSSSTVR